MKTGATKPPWLQDLSQVERRGAEASTNSCLGDVGIVAGVDEWRRGRSVAESQVIPGPLSGPLCSSSVRDRPVSDSAVLPPSKAHQGKPLQTSGSSIESAIYGDARCGIFRASRETRFRLGSSVFAMISSKW